MTEVEILSWWNYWWVTEMFDRSLPHTMSRHGVAIPLDGWPSNVSHAFARRMREVLGTMGNPPREDPRRIRGLLVPAWIGLAQRLIGATRDTVSANDVMRLRAFGVVVLDAGYKRVRIFKFGKPMIEEEVTPFTEAAVNAMVGLEPEDCAHLHVIDHDHGALAPSHGLCLRCCTMRPFSEITLGHGHRPVLTMVKEPVISTAPRPVTMPTITIPSVALPPDFNDRACEAIDSAGDKTGSDQCPPNNFGGRLEVPVVGRLALAVGLDRRAGAPVSNAAQAIVGERGVRPVGEPPSKGHVPVLEPLASDLVPEAGLDHQGPEHGLVAHHGRHAFDAGQSVDGLPVMNGQAGGEHGHAEGLGGGGLLHHDRIVDLLRSRFNCESERRQRTLF